VHVYTGQFRLSRLSYVTRYQGQRICAYYGAEAHGFDVRNYSTREMNMTATTQTYANYTRWHPPFHFFVAPVLLINVIWSIVHFFYYPGWNQGWAIVVSIALVVLAVIARSNALRAQDRIIRLEEQIRYKQILPADFAEQSRSLTINQIIALRFAPDEEVETLVRGILEGRLKKSSDIKRAINNWRADNLRV
jgi:hypothetical protein